MLDHRRPDNAFGRVVWVTRFAAHAEDGANRRPDGLLIATDYDHCRSSAPWNVSARGVRDQTQIPLRKESLDELGAEFTLHERVACDLPHPARPLVALGEGEEMLHKRHGKSIFALTDISILGAVDLVERLLRHFLVRRVAAHHLVSPPPPHRDP